MPRLQTGRRSPLFYAGLIALQCLLWGVGNPLMKIGISRMPPLLLLTLRYLAATALFALFFGRRCLKGLRRVSPGLLAAVCGFTAMSFICANLGLLHTSATNASFLMGMAVLFAPFFAPLFLGTRFHAGDLVPVAVTVAGLYLMCGMSGVPHFGLGEWLGLLSACFGAASMVLTPKLLVEMDAVSLAATQSATTGLCCLAASLLTEGLPRLGEVPAVSWLVIAYSVIACTFIAYLLQNTALRWLEPCYVALLMCSEPVFSAAAAFLMLHERLSARGLAGALLILASMAMAAFGQREGPEAPGGPEPQTAQEEDAPQRALREEASAPGA